ncbi:MAG: methyltransferase domain-containing protein [Myxococcota bacterium]
MNSEITLEDFKKYYPYAPTALAIKECVRLHSMRGLECPGPILDVGCGDGLFAKLAFGGQQEVWGIDIDGNEGRRAQASRAYSHVILADVTQAVLPEGFFGSCVANCSLEHVPDIDAAARAIHRSLKPGGVFYTFLPAKDWADSLLVAQTLRKFGLESLASTVTEAINSVFKHRHLEDAAGWRRIFENAKFVVDRVDPIGTTASTMAFEAFLIPSLAGRLNKALTGKWTLVPGLRQLGAVPIYAIIKALLAANPQQIPTAEFLLVAHKP